MKEREIGECLKRETLERLTEEAFREAPARRKRTGPALALAASLVIVVGLCFPGPVYGAVRRLLYFLPGGGVTEELPESYWIPAEDLYASADGVDYLVTYLYRRGDTLALRVEKKVKGSAGQAGQSVQYGEQTALPESGADGSSGHVDHSVQYHDGQTAPPEEDTPGIRTLPQSGPAPEAIPLSPQSRPAPMRYSGGIEIALRDEAGQLLEAEHQERGTFAVYDETTGDREFAEEREIPDFTLERFTLVLDGRVELPVVLRQVDTADYALDGALTLRDAGYDLSLLPLNGGCTRFALIPQPAEREGIPAGTYWNSPTFDIQASGEDGTLWPVESVGSRPGSQEYYVAGLPETGITGITVTGILESTRYDLPPASLTLPGMALGEERALDRELRLWNMTFRAEAAGLDSDGKLWVRLRLPEEQGGIRFNQLDLEWPETEEHGVAGGIYREGSVTYYREGMAGRAGKATRLEVSFASVVREGRWEFRL